MRKLLVLGGVVLCLSMTAAAQDDPAALDASSPASQPAAPVSFHPPEREPWQLEIGYQFQHYKALGQTFHNNGLHTSLTRYLNDSFGIEVAAVSGFGSIGAPLNIVAKSLFIGGGPHFAVHNTSRFEPWFHGLVGWQHFRFTQTNDVIGLGSNSALGFMVGGGVDFKLRPRVFWRIQGDYIGTRFQSATQSNYSFGTGLVFNF